MSNRYTHDDINLLMLRYLAGEATEEELAELREVTDHDTGLAECLFQNACQEVELHDYFRKMSVSAEPIRSGRTARPVMKAVFACASLAALLIGLYVLLPPDPRLIRGNPIVSDVASGVMIIRKGLNIQATENMTLSQNDIVEVSAAGVARIQYLDEETTLVLQPHASIQILSDKSGKCIRLLRGSIQATVARQPAGKPMRILSEDGVVEVMGTRLVFGTDAHATRVDTMEGSVALVSEKSGKKQVVEAGDYAQIDTRGVLTSGTTIPRVVDFTLVYADTHEPIPGYDPVPDTVTVDMTSLYIKQPGRIACRINTEPAVIDGVTVQWVGTMRKVLNDSPFIMPLGQDNDYYLPQDSIGRTTGWSRTVTPFSLSGSNRIEGLPRYFHITVHAPKIEGIAPGELKVINGSFESPAVTEQNWAFRTPIGWNATRMPIIRAGSKPFAGKQCFFLRKPVTLSQALWGDAQPGRRYRLHFAVRLREEESSVVARVLSGSDTLAVIEVTYPDAGEWEAFSKPFTVPDELQGHGVRIAFDLVNVELDDVRVEGE
jgi:hypothetical protein